MAVAGATSAAPALVLTWTDNSDDETGFTIQRRQAAAPETDWMQIAVVGANVATYTDTYVFAGVAYAYRVNAYNAYGMSDWSNTAEATAPAAGTPPNAPIEMEARPIGQLVNMSMRALVLTGDGVLIPGIVVTGGEVQVLIRAVGPTIGAAPYNVPGTLANPFMELVGGPSNDDWTGADVAAAAAAVGAFPLPVGSKDSAMLITLQPGAYTLHISGRDNTVGIVLVEVYRVP